MRDFPKVEDAIIVMAKDLKVGDFVYVKTGWLGVKNSTNHWRRVNKIEPCNNSNAPDNDIKVTFCQFDWESGALRDWYKNESLVIVKRK